MNYNQGNIRIVFVIIMLLIATYLFLRQEEPLPTYENTETITQEVDTSTPKTQIQTSTNTTESFPTMETSLETMELETQEIELEIEDLMFEDLGFEQPASTM